MPYNSNNQLVDAAGNLVINTPSSAMSHPTYNGQTSSGPMQLGKSATGSSPYFGMGTVPQGGKPSLGQSIIGYNSVGENGATMSNPGYGGIALGAFNAWNSWNQGNKMYDLQSEALDFSQDQYWNNFMMQRGLMNDELNTKNRARYISSQRGGGSGESDRDLVNRAEDQYNRTDALVRADGSTYNMAGNNAPAEFNSPMVNSAASWDGVPAQVPAVVTNEAAAGAGAGAGTAATAEKNKDKDKEKEKAAAKSGFIKKKLGT